GASPQPPPARTVPLRAMWWAVLGFVVGEVLGGVLALAVVLASGAKVTSAGATLAGEAGLWAGLLGAVVFVSRHEGSGSLRRDFGFAFRPIDLLYGLGAAVAGLIVADLVELAFSGTRFAGSNTQILSGQRGNGLGYAVVTIIVAAGAPVVEELFFRGLIRTALAARLGPQGAIWGQAVLFGLAHTGGAHGLGNVSVVVAIGLLGVVLGYTAHFSRRLAGGMVAHSLFNLTAALTILLH
ncbi:MAG: type II CAAX endopeptidase family protein, partial [Actinomycetota bacterium]|nr:type II CAAX endopeptidase family protein [Actinomycetota bacterium]